MITFAFYFTLSSHFCNYFGKFVRFSCTVVLAKLHLRKCVRALITDTTETAERGVWHADSLDNACIWTGREKMQAMVCLGASYLMLNMLIMPIRIIVLWRIRWLLELAFTGKIKNAYRILAMKPIGQSHLTASVPSYSVTRVWPQSEVHWANLNRFRFHLKTNTESSLRNAVL
jgi:hypothetical protein